ncbi:S-methyl-5-thioribose-1-phosphate isomerase [Salinarimonas ramus]|uniref:Methylthioribose-1-phosphate isomerase n=1 Tax=Salinarimonas ramus TaxID=690164 RepID=A0A917Q8U9_9HYPH|nr:S-methyl-5-thioribose-1-phosphate isomerase [Salinarimonas ramus]GGK36194.1 methylthioribose-1-phosphate isomerase [Salinarimonas ramus]
MRIHGRHYRTIFPAEDGAGVSIIDQTKLPFAFEIARLSTVEEAATAIRDMQVRGAPLIGATAAYGIALAMDADASDEALAQAVRVLGATRPTAVNLHWALSRVENRLAPLSGRERVRAAWTEAEAICDEDVEQNHAIGANGARLLAEIHAKTGRTVNVLTHCNAGWLATVDWGTALSPIYQAHDAGIPVHVYVDETRPRNQGAALTAYELGAHGVPHTVVVDNAGGHLMQHGKVDICFVGSDRTTASGDVCNKIGTYLKALAARDNDVPFYVTLPVTTIDWSLDDGLAEIPIEERSAREVTNLVGIDEDGAVHDVRVVAPGSPAANPAFDVTPARLVAGLVTERGICPASREGIAGLYPDYTRSAAE